jgi:hypothetical protein
VADPAGISRRSHDLALVASDDRITVQDLNALDRPPLILEGTAMEIWELLDGSLDRDGLIGRLSQRYAAPADEVAAGVTNFLEVLAGLDLLDAGERSAPDA